MSDGCENPSKVEAFKNDLFNIERKLESNFCNVFNQYICLLSDAEVQEKELVKDNFIATTKSKLDSLHIMLNKKVRDVPLPSSTSTTSGFVDRKTDQTYLKKLDPPDFKGDIVEYTDFVRKWKAQVGKAGLSQESELDRLRDHVPSQASKALYGETTMEGAWKVLDKLFGDKDLVTNKLKTQLKNIKPKGKSDHDLIIDLVTEVNNITLR